MEPGLAIGERDERDESSLTRRERRSLAFGRATAVKLLADPETVLTQARRNLMVKRRANPYSGSYLDEWERILTEGPAAAAEMLSSTSQRASDLRSASPFAGTLPEEERWAIIQATARVTQDATRRA